MDGLTVTVTVAAAACLLLAVLFLVLGVQFGRGKWAHLIAGYNTMDAREKARVDLPRLRRAVAAAMYWSAALCVCVAAGVVASYAWDSPVVALVLAAVPTAGLVASCVRTVRALSPSDRD